MIKPAGSFAVNVRMDNGRVETHWFQPVVRSLTNHRPRKRSPKTSGAAARVRNYLLKFGMDEPGEIAAHLRMLRGLVIEMLQRRDVTAVLRRKPK